MARVAIILPKKEGWSQPGKLNVTCQIYDTTLGDFLGLFLVLNCRKYPVGNTGYPISIPSILGSCSQEAPLSPSSYLAGDMAKQEIFGRSARMEHLDTALAKLFPITSVQIIGTNAFGILRDFYWVSTGSASKDHTTI